MPFRFVDEPSPPKQQVNKSRYRFVEEEPSLTQKIASSGPAQFALGTLKKLTFPADIVKLATEGASREVLQDLAENDPDLDKEVAEQARQKAMEYIPTQQLGEELAEKYTGLDLSPKGTVGKIGRFGGEILGLQPGSLLEHGVKGLVKKGAEATTRATVGQGLKELGVPGPISDIAALSGPSASKKIIPTQSQRELVEGARELGLSEAEIAPLIQSPMKQKLFSKITPRRGRTKKILDKSYQALGNVYDRLESNPIATSTLSSEANREVIQAISDKMEKFPAELRKLIQEDFLDLVKEPISGSNLINFFKDINYYLGKGNNQLGVLKEPVIKALEDISPQLASDFRLTNKLYAKYADISKKLKPTLVSDLYTAGEAIRLITGLSLGNVPLIGELVTEEVGRQISRELLLNPRLQNISKKMMNALNENKFSLANTFAKSYIKEIKELNPEIAEKLKGVDFTSLQNATNK